MLSVPSTVNCQLNELPALNDFYQFYPIAYEDLKWVLRFT